MAAQAYPVPNPTSNRAVPLFKLCRTCDYVHKEGIPCLEAESFDEMMRRL